MVYRFLQHLQEVLLSFVIVGLGYEVLTQQKLFLIVGKSERMYKATLGKA